MRKSKTTEDLWDKKAHIIGTLTVGIAAPAFPVLHIEKRKQVHICNHSDMLLV